MTTRKLKVNSVMLKMKLLLTMDSDSLVETGLNMNGLKINTNLFNNRRWLLKNIKNTRSTIITTIIIQGKKLFYKKNLIGLLTLMMLMIRKLRVKWVMVTMKSSSTVDLPSLVESGLITVLLLTNISPKSITSPKPKKKLEIFS